MIWEVAGAAYWPQRQFRPRSASVRASSAGRHPASRGPVRPSPRLLWTVRHFFTLKLPGPSRTRGRTISLTSMRLVQSLAARVARAARRDRRREGRVPAAGLAWDAALGYYRALRPTLPASHRKRISVPTVSFAGTDDNVDPAMFDRAASVVHRRLRGRARAREQALHAPRAPGGVHRGARAKARQARRPTLRASHSVAKEDRRRLAWTRRGPVCALSLHTLSAGAGDGARVACATWRARATCRNTFRCGLRIGCSAPTASLLDPRRDRPCTRTPSNCPAGIAFRKAAFPCAGSTTPPTRAAPGPSAHLHAARVDLTRGASPAAPRGGRICDGSTASRRTSCAARVRRWSPAAPSSFVVQAKAEPDLRDAGLRRDLEQRRDPETPARPDRRPPSGRPACTALARMGLGPPRRAWSARSAAEVGVVLRVSQRGRTRSRRRARRPRRTPAPAEIRAATGSLVEGDEDHRSSGWAAHASAALRVELLPSSASQRRRLRMAACVLLGASVWTQRPAPAGGGANDNHSPGDHRPAPRGGEGC